MTKAQVKALVAEAKLLQRAIEQSNEYRKRFDAITDLLLDERSEAAKCGCIVVDLFADKNVTWKSVAAKRFNLEFEAPTQPNNVFKVRRSRGGK